MHARLSALPPDLVRAVHGRGLSAGVEFTSLPGREACERLAARGLLAKDTHGTAIRLAPPLVITAGRARLGHGPLRGRAPRLGDGSPCGRLDLTLRNAGQAVTVEPEGISC